MSDLERLLERGRDTLPEPDPEVTSRAFARALAALRRQPHRVRTVVLVTVALAIAIGLGTGFGVLLTPGGTASRGPVALGFLPVPGWFAYQTGTETSPLFQTVAVASNVQLDSEDVVAGAADPSGLPYATLLGLPPDGIVMVASVTRPDGVPAFDASYPKAELPLRLADAATYVPTAALIRPEEPLGQLQLRATVQGRRVDVIVYFGRPDPPGALRAEAQRQLDRLVVRSAPSTETDTAEHPAATTTPSTPAVIDRTLRCTTAPSGGIREVETRANAGIRLGSRWKQLPYAVASSGNVGSTLDPLGDALVWITAGRPSADTTADWGFRTAQVSRWGTLAVSRGACRIAKATVPLSRAGLEGSAVSPFGEKLDCPAPRRVLVRVRAIAAAKVNLRARGAFLATNVPMKSGRLVVTTEAGRRLMYADVVESGKARLFTAKGCVFD